jgi:hypothetical protein
MDLQHGHKAWTWSMDTQHGHEVQKFRMVILHEKAAETRIHLNQDLCFFSFSPVEWIWALETGVQCDAAKKGKKLRIRAVFLSSLALLLFFTLVLLCSQVYLLPACECKSMGSGPPPLDCQQLLSIFICISV